MRFGILGPLAVWRDGEPVEIGGLRVRMVLVLLLLDACRTVSSARLIEGRGGGVAVARASPRVARRPASMRRPRRPMPGALTAQARPPGTFANGATAWAITAGGPGGLSIVRVSAGAGCDRHAPLGGRGWRGCPFAGAAVWHP